MQADCFDGQISQRVKMTSYTIWRLRGCGDYNKKSWKKNCRELKFLFWRYDSVLRCLPLKSLKFKLSKQSMYLLTFPDPTKTKGTPDRRLVYLLKIASKSIRSRNSHCSSTERYCHTWICRTQIKPIWARKTRTTSSSDFFSSWDLKKFENSLKKPFSPCLNGQRCCQR